MKINRFVALVPIALLAVAAMGTSCSSNSPVSDVPTNDAAVATDLSPVSGDNGTPTDATVATDLSPVSGGNGMATDAGVSSVSYDDFKGWVDAYKAAHPGNGGKDWDINAKTPTQIAADAAARQLLSICGKEQRPVIPLLAWEYGGVDHQWISPTQSALVYCVYIPVKDASTNWQYDAAADHVTADVYVRFPDQNPCNDQQGANQAVVCIGDSTNFEILVDTASLHDGKDAGLSLANATTDLTLFLEHGTKVHLWSN